MVPKQPIWDDPTKKSFRAVLFRMVPKLVSQAIVQVVRFRAVLFRMVPKLQKMKYIYVAGFRAVLFRMVPKPVILVLSLV